MKVGSWINDPKQMADLIAKHNSNKVKTLRSQRRRHPNIDPVVRLERALSQRGTSSSSNLPTEYNEPEGVTQTEGATFRLQEITANKLKELLKSYKGVKALGGDELDGYLMKTASRVILPVLLHIIKPIQQGRTVCI